jgi:hypothetical protein
MYENTRARVFIHCFLVFGYPGETLALVVHILHTTLYKTMQQYIRLYDTIQRLYNLDYKNYDTIQDYT